MASLPLGQIRATLRHRALAALLDQGAVSVASFGTGILLSRAFAGPQRAQLGLYYLAVTIGILIMEVQNALVSTPHMVTAPTLKPERLRRFNGSALIHHAVLSALITGALAVFALAAPAIGLASHQPMLIACAVTAGALGLRNFARFLNFALHRPFVSCAADWLVTILQLIGILALSRMHWLSAWSAVGVIGAASLAGGVTALLMSRAHFRMNLPQAVHDFRENWRLSRWVFASGVVWNVGTNLYPWMIDTFNSTLQAAVWGNCNTVASLGNPLLMGLQNWLAPAVAHAYADRSRARFRAYVCRAALMFAALLPPMLLVLFFISNPLLHRVYRDPDGQHFVARAGSGSGIGIANGELRDLPRFVFAGPRRSRSVGEHRSCRSSSDRRIFSRPSLRRIRRGDQPFDRADAGDGRAGGDFLGRRRLVGGFSRRRSNR